jgi:hypothetical protein
MAGRRRPNPQSPLMPRTRCASIGVARDPERDDLMCACLRVSDIDGKQWAIDLTLDDVKHLLLDLRSLLEADQATVDRWWRQLASGADGRPRAPRAAVRP